MFDNAPPTVEVTEAKVIPRRHLGRIPCSHESMEKHLKKYVALVRELGADDTCIVKVGNFIKGGA